MNLQSQKADKTPNNNSVEYDITKDLAKRRCHHCQQEGHYVKSCPRKNQSLYHGGSQSQVNIGLPPASDRDTQYKGSP